MSINRSQNTVRSHYTWRTKWSTWDHETNTHGTETSTS